VVPNLSVYVNAEINPMEIQWPLKQLPSMAVTLLP
jgi:hypothetical protein